MPPKSRFVKSKGRFSSPLFSLVPTSVSQTARQLVPAWKSLAAEALLPRPFPASDIAIWSLSDVFLAELEDMQTAVRTTGAGHGGMECMYVPRYVHTEVGTRTWSTSTNSASTGNCRVYGVLQSPYRLQTHDVFRPPNQMSTTWH